MFYKDPWRHIVYDNFFPDTIFNNLKKSCLNMKEDDEFFFHTTGNRYNYSCFFNPEGKLLDYQSRDHNDIEKILSKEAILETYSYVLPHVLKVHRYFSKDSPYRELNMGLQKITKDYVAVPHVDGANKLLSLINYVSPSKNIGTDIMIDSMNVYKTVRWRENRTLIFKREENVTWHNFRSDNFQDRIVFYVNLY